MSVAIRQATSRRPAHTCNSIPRKECLSTPMPTFSGKDMGLNNVVPIAGRACGWKPVLIRIQPTTGRASRFNLVTLACAAGLDEEGLTSLEKRCAPFFPSDEEGLHVAWSRFRSSARRRAGVRPVWRRMNVVMYCTEGNPVRFATVFKGRSEPVIRRRVAASRWRMYSS
jgi:hypothetical protein